VENPKERILIYIVQYKYFEILYLVLPIKGLKRIKPCSYSKPLLKSYNKKNYPQNRHWV
jgi:hypothetical protein